MHYGARTSGGLIDAWLVDDADAGSVDAIRATALDCVAIAAMMTDVDATARMAAHCLDAADRVRATR